MVLYGSQFCLYGHCSRIVTGALRACCTFGVFYSTALFERTSDDDDDVVVVDDDDDDDFFAETATSQPPISGL